MAIACRRRGGVTPLAIPEDIDMVIYKVGLGALRRRPPSINQQQRALAGKVDEAARVYISGPSETCWQNEIAASVEAAEQPGHLSLGFGFDAYL